MTPARIGIVLAEASAIEEDDLLVIPTYFDNGPVLLDINFLEKRFGVAPSSLRERIFAADVGQTDAWVERAFDAPDLYSIFDTH
jgi:hypothetical protein